jgi:two-component system chemotaxis response regulator CheB
MPKQVLIVEDVDTMRELLVHVVGGIPGLEISGVAKNGWEARLELSRRKPDIVLLDEILPGETSGDLVAEFQAAGVSILMLTSLEKPTHPLPHGAAGRITKPGWESIEADRARIGKSIFSVVS